MTQSPAYLCQGSDGSWSDCTAEEICQDGITNWKIDEDNEKSLKNWWIKLDLRCEPSWKYQFIGTAFFLGWCCTLLWVPLLSDKHGRKPFFIFGMIGELLFMTVMVITVKLNVMIFASFVIGLLCSFRINVGYIYLMELMPKQY